jgi:hypothetical protein
MNIKTVLASLSAVTLLVCTTGCFRVSSDTRALRDVALEFAAPGAEEKIEIGVGFFTVGLAKVGTRFIELPPEVRTLLGAVKNVECSVYEVRERQGDISQFLVEADRAMNSRGSDRIVGVIDADQVVAVYVPRDVKSEHNMKLSVVVLTRNELICATARGDLEPLVQMAYSKAEERLPRKAAF